MTTNFTYVDQLISKTISSPIGAFEVVVIGIKEGIVGYMFGQCSGILMLEMMSNGYDVIAVAYKATETDGKIKYGEYHYL